LAEEIGGVGGVELDVGVGEAVELALADFVGGTKVVAAVEVVGTDGGVVSSWGADTEVVVDGD
jgi:hypothetical protein